MTPSITTLSTDEPGSPLLVAAADPPDLREGLTFATPDDLAARVHQLRGRAGLDVTAAAASLGGDYFACVCVWRVLGEQRDFLAVAAGPGVNTPSLLLAALKRTAPANARASAA